MFQRKPRRFRHHRNGRGPLSHGNGSMQSRLRSNSFSNSQTRNNFGTTHSQTRNNFGTTQSAKKLFEKYNALAKEAISSGDKTLGENYLQHADHFMRIIEDKNKNREQSKINIIDKSTVDAQRPSENRETKQEDVTKNKE